MNNKEMTGYQLKQLSLIKKLVRLGKRRFVNRKDRDYIQDLLEIGLSVESAWNEILLLSKADYWYDNKDAYIFEKR